MPKNIEPMKLTECRICFRALKENQTKYCSDNCKSQDYQIKKRFEELKKENPNLELIYWNKNDNPDGEMEWRKIKGVEHNPYKIIKKPVTKRKSKKKSN